MFLPDASNPHSPPQDVTVNRHAIRGRRRDPLCNSPIPIPFLWATECREKIHNLNHLLQNGIF